MLQLRRFSALAALSIVGFGLTGCGKKIATVCEEKCGGAADVEACTTAQTTYEGTAEERGCESEFEDYAACADAKGTCTDGVLDTSRCVAEEEALAACAK